MVGGSEHLRAADVACLPFRQRPVGGLAPADAEPRQRDELEDGDGGGDE
jgi:hypothetical protein